MKQGNWKSRKAWKQDAQRNLHRNRIAKGTGAPALDIRVHKQSPLSVAANMVHDAFKFMRRGRR